MKRIKIENRWVGEGEPCFIIAELSCNHNQSFDLAVKTLRAAKEAGADAIKLQTFSLDAITLDCNSKYFQIDHGTLWDGTTLYELYKKAYTPWEWLPDLMAMAKKLGLICFSAPGDKAAVDYLEKLGVPAYKIASFEITDLPLIEYVAAKGKPLILSTGIATREDIEEALSTCFNQGNDQIALLKCLSAYPAPPEESNLKMIPYLENEFQTVVGLSDHSLGSTVPLVAIPLGAKIIEKHFIIDRKLNSLDSEFSMEPAEFKEMVRSVREAESILGKVGFELTEKIIMNRKFCRSLFVVEDIKKGAVFSGKNVKSIRPGYGLPPKNIKAIIGEKAGRDIEKGTPLGWDLLDSEGK
ncbi:MAG: pseudaminic acid synthase [Candidatus Margulisiibacteriota bacterium]